MFIALNIAAVFALLAGCLHGYIFILESWHWTEPQTRAVFSISSEQEAENTKEMAFNQGFYNMFLGIMAMAGAIVFWCGAHTVGVTLMAAGTASMFGAATVLFAGSPDKRSAAIKQAALPFVALVALVVAWALA